MILVVLAWWSLLVTWFFSPACLFMYVCLFVCGCRFMYVFVYTCVFRLCMCVCLYVGVFIMYVFVHTCVFWFMYVFVYMWVYFMYSFVYTCVFWFIYVFVLYIYVYLFIYVCLFVSVWKNGTHEDPYIVYHILSHNMIYHVFWKISQKHRQHLLFLTFSWRFICYENIYFSYLMEPFPIHNCNHVSPCSSSVLRGNFRFLSQSFPEFEHLKVLSRLASASWKGNFFLLSPNLATVHLYSPYFGILYEHI